MFKIDIELILIRSANIRRRVSLFVWNSWHIFPRFLYERIPVSAPVLSRASIVRRKQFVVFQSENEKGGLIFRALRDLHYILKPETVDQ